VGAQVLVTDDADGFKSAADELGLLHRVCKSHVKRNTQALIEDLRPLVAKDSDGSLKASGVASTQAVADLDRLAELISSRQPEQGCELEEMHHRYLSAAPPKKGAVASLAYRLRLLYLDRSPLGSRLTRYRKWRGPERQSSWMAPIMPVNEPLAGGSRNAIARCAATRSQLMPYASVVFSLGAATFSTVVEPTWPRSFGKAAQTGKHMAFLSHSLIYHSPNDHDDQEPLYRQPPDVLDGVRHPARWLPRRVPHAHQSRHPRLTSIAQEDQGRTTYVNFRA